MELVIMAAGMGSRFGGLKQITPVGPNGEFLIDYCIYDAKQAGFDKVVFIIKEEMYKDFQETIGKRLENKIKIEYAFQDIKDVPSNANIPDSRTKPLGTGHALYSTRNIVKEPFAVISSDDYYGKDAFKQVANFLKNEDNYCLVGYEVGTTLTENGSVKRGVCFEENGILKNIIESKIEKINGIIECESIDTKEKYTIEENHPVTMLLYGLRPDIFPFIEKDIVRFFNDTKDLQETEYFLPNILDHMMEEGKIIKVIPTTSTWRGMTYSKDLQETQEFIRKEIQKGNYPKNLWG